MDGGLISEFMRYRECYLHEASQMLQINFVGDDRIFQGLNLCNRESRYHSIISYITSEQLIEAVLLNKAITVLFLTAELLDCVQRRISREMSFLVVPNPEEMFYRLHEILCQKNFYHQARISPQVGKNCDIHPTAVVEDNVIIGDDVVIGANSVVKSGSVIENGVRIGCCSVVGSEGFQGIRFSNGEAHVVTHVGGTRLCKNVFIGDNTTVGNALFEGETVVGENTKIDNHVHIAHNLTIGKNNIITACSLLMGSAVLEDYTWLAPNAVVMNKRVIHNHGFVGSMSLVTKDVPENTTVVGIPAKVWDKKH